MGAVPWFSSERKLTGTTRLILGFIVGALFALLPMYYFYMGRDAALGGSAPSQPQPLETVAAPSRRAAESSIAPTGSKPFASRMTYELSQLPEELPPPRPKPASTQVASAQPARRAEPPTPVAPPVPEEALATARVVNARPISAVPPDPRDTTREMEKEAHRPEYKERAPKPQAKAATQSTEPRVIEGRDIEVKGARLPATPTRPIAANAPANTRQEIEAERSRRPRESVPTPQVTASTAKKPIESRTVVAAGPPVAGVTPITKPPEEPPRDATAAAPKFVVVTPPAPTAASSEAASRDIVEGRLAATRDWLSAAPQTTHTIQLMGTNSEEQLKSHLKVLSKALEPSKIYVFRTVAQGKPSMTVVYGAYADRQSALQALEKLPPAIAANKPVLRTVNGIRAEMKQHGTAG